METLKKYWYIIVLIIGFIYFFMFSSKSRFGKHKKRTSKNYYARTRARQMSRYIYGRRDAFVNSRFVSKRKYLKRNKYIKRHRKEMADYLRWGRR